MEPEKIVKKFSGELLRKSGVVTVGLGTKVVGGFDTGKTALVVGVRQKLPLSQLAPKDVVPREIKGLVTDVIQSGEVKVQNGELDRTKKWRPAPGGVSIGHRDVTAGTLGCLVYKKGVPKVLSNNHVLGNMNKAVKDDPVYQPGVYDGFIRIHHWFSSFPLGWQVKVFTIGILLGCPPADTQRICYCLYALIFPFSKVFDVFDLCHY